MLKKGLSATSAFLRLWTKQTTPELDWAVLLFTGLLLHETQILVLMCPSPTLMIATEVLHMHFYARICIKREGESEREREREKEGKIERQKDRKAERQKQRKKEDKTQIQ